MNFRGLTAFLTLSGFLLMTLTGIVLYFEPEGRIAYWVDWTFLGLTKSDWGNIHVISSFLWVIAGAFHLYFNWKILMAYFYRKAKGGWNLKKELITAVVVSVLVVIVSMYPVPPFSNFLDLGDTLKSSWVEGPEFEPPFGHAELLSLKVFCKKTNIDLDLALAEFKQKGYTVDSPQTTLADIAAANHVSPKDLYSAIRQLEEKIVMPKTEKYTVEKVEEMFAGQGIGKKSFVRLVEDFSLDAAEIRARMSGKGLDIADDETVKDAGERYSANPMDFLKAMLVDDYQLDQ